MAISSLPPKTPNNSKLPVFVIIPLLVTHQPSLAFQLPLRPTSHQSSAPPPVKITHLVIQLLSLILKQSFYQLPLIQKKTMTINQHRHHHHHHRFQQHHQQDQQILLSPHQHNLLHYQSIVSINITFIINAIILLVQHVVHYLLMIQ